MTGEIFTETPVSAMRGTAMRPTTDIQTTSAQVMASVIVAGVTARRDGLERSVSILCPAPCLWRAV